MTRTSISVEASHAASRATFFETFLSLIDSYRFTSSFVLSMLDLIESVEARAISTSFDATNIVETLRILAKVLGIVVFRPFSLGKSLTAAEMSRAAASHDRFLDTEPLGVVARIESASRTGCLALTVAWTSEYLMSIPRNFSLKGAAGRRLLNLIGSVQRCALVSRFLCRVS